MGEITFEVVAPPHGKGRPRFRKTGNFVSTYTPSNTKNYEKLVKKSYLAVSDYCFPPKTPLAIKIISEFPIPKSTSKKARSLILSGKEFPTKKPDFDNICKVVCDALNGTAFYDDAQIVLAYIEKKYSENPKTIVTITELE